MPLINKLQMAFVGDEAGGMGGGYGGVPDAFPQEQGMGGMGMGGMGGAEMPAGYEEAMMQQIEMLKQQDPQAYAQLMAMMSAQQGR